MADNPIGEHRLASLRHRWEQDPSSRLFVQLAEAHRRREELDEALEVLEKGLTFHPNYLSAMIVQARCLLQADRAAPARTVLESVVSRDPTHLVAGQLLVETHLQLGERAAALESLERYRLLGAGGEEFDELERRATGFEFAESPEALDDLLQMEAASEQPEEPAEAEPMTQSGAGGQLAVRPVSAMGERKLEESAPFGVIDQPTVPISLPESPSAQGQRILLRVSDSPPFLGILSPVAPLVGSVFSVATLGKTGSDDEVAAEAMPSRGEDGALAAAVASEAVGLLDSPPEVSEEESVAAEPSAPESKASEAAVVEATSEAGTSDSIAEPELDEASDQGASEELTGEPDAGSETDWSSEVDEPAAAPELEAKAEQPEHSSDSESSSELELSSDSESSSGELGALDTESDSFAAVDPETETSSDIEIEPEQELGIDTSSDESGSTAEDPDLKESDELDEEASQGGVLDPIHGEESATVDEADISAEPQEPTDDDSVAAGAAIVTATLGSLYLSQGHTDEAERVFREVLANEPANEDALLGLAEVEAQRVDHDEPKEAQLEAPTGEAPDVEAPDDESPAEETPDEQSPEEQAPEEGIPEEEVREEPAQDEQVQPDPQPAETADLVQASSRVAEDEFEVVPESMGSNDQGNEAAARPAEDDFSSAVTPPSDISPTFDRELTALDLMGHESVEARGLTARKLLLLEQYLERLRGKGI